MHALGIPSNQGDFTSKRRRKNHDPEKEAKRLQALSDVFRMPEIERSWYKAGLVKEDFNRLR